MNKVYERAVLLPVKHRKTKPDKYKKLFMCLSIIPALILFMLIVILPVFNLLYSSLLEWNGLDGEKIFIGIENYKVLFGSSGFWKAFSNTVFLILLVTAVTIVLALTFASMLAKSKMKGKTFFRIVLYIPNILSIVVISAIFTAIYSPDYGIFKLISNIFNGSYGGILGDSKTVMWGIAIAMIWQAIGYYMVMYIAAMDGIPDQLYEAADLEGCGKLRQFFVITLPLTWEIIRVTLTFFIISTINMSYMFVDAMTSGANNSHVLLTFMRDQINKNGTYGYAMAIGMVLFVFAYGLALIIQAITRRDPVEY